MKSQHSGFTLLEMIAVLVILAILAVTALPKFVDLTLGSKRAAIDGVAGNLASAMAMNYSGAVAQAASIPGATYWPVEDCVDGKFLLLDGLPPGYVITPDPSIASLGLVTVCMLTANALTQTFQGIGAP